MLFADEPEVFCQAKQLQRPDAVPVEINFVPRQPVLRSSGMCVVIVVPTFAKRKQRNPPAIGGIVPGFEAAGSPQVSG